MNKSYLAACQKIMSAAPMLTAIAQSQSFSTAARQLGLQQSAVSHKVRTLEQVLGFTLFNRTTRKIELTAQGAIICEACKVSTTAVSTALKDTERLSKSGTIVLSLPSSLAMKWVLPAMKRARERGLEITLDIDDSLTPLGTGRAAEVAIRFGAGPYPGLHVQLLSKCDVMSVSCKALALNLHPTSKQETFLLRDSIAEEDGTGMTWETYLGTHDLDGRFENTVTFSRSDIALQAAIGGLGHAMGRSLLIENDLDLGLMFVSGPLVRTKAKYWIVTTPDFAATKKYQTLADWLLSEVSRSARILQNQSNPYDP